MQMITSQPSYGQGSMTSLGAAAGPSANAVTYTMDGVDMAVEPGGLVYRKVNGAWTVDNNLSATLNMANAYSPGIVADAQSSSSGFDFNSLLQSISQLAQTYITADAQHDLLQANIDRASKGLPPLQAQNYMPGVNVGVAADTQKLLMYGGLGVLAMFAISQLNRRR